MSQCQRKTTSGGACKIPAMKGTRYCFTHNPDAAEARTAARKLGGYNSATQHAGDPLQVIGKPRNIEQAFTILDYVKDETLAMDNGIPRNRLLVSIATAYIDAVKQGDLETQLKELTAILAARAEPLKAQKIKGR